MFTDYLLTCQEPCFKKLWLQLQIYQENWLELTGVRVRI